jgi:hypothetical protein
MRSYNPLLPSATMALAGLLCFFVISVGDEVKGELQQHGPILLTVGFWKFCDVTLNLMQPCEGTIRHFIINFWTCCIYCMQIMCFIALSVIRMKAYFGMVQLLYKNVRSSGSTAHSANSGVTVIAFGTHCKLHPCHVPWWLKVCMEGTCPLTSRCSAGLTVTINWPGALLGPYGLLLIWFM